jgi:tetratricopeptide (TPR) repeat protein
MPGSPVIIKLNMMALDKEKDKAKLLELYTSLPEKTPQEMVEKSQMAQYCGRSDETIRLLEMVRAVRPDDLELLGSLAQLYLDAGDRTRAGAIIDQAMAKAPDNARLKLLAAQIQGGDVVSMRREVIEKIKDPFDKEMAQFELAMQENREEDALAHVKAANQLKPDNSRPMAVLFSFALAQKNFEEAARLMETLARMNADNANGLLYRVKYALAKGNVDDAAAKAQQLTQMMPEFAHSWVVLGQVQIVQGQNTPAKYAEAMQNFMTALTKQAQNLDAIRGVIACAYALGQPTTARRYIDEGRKLFPTTVILRELEIDYELQYGDAEKAIAPRQEMLDQAIAAKSPAEARAWLQLGATYVIVARGKTGAAAKPFLEKARDTLKAGMEKFPDELRFVQNYANVCMRLGNNADGEKAIQDLLNRDAWKGKPEPTLMLAQYYEKIGKGAEQEKLLRDYLASSPDNVMVLRDLALLLSHRGKLDEALKMLEPRADDPDVRKMRIELQINGGRLADAEKEIKDVLARTPNPPPVLLIRLAYVYMNSARASDALNVLNQVLKSSPDNADALLMRSMIYVSASRNLDQAIRDLSAVRDTLDDVDSRMTLAEAYIRKGDDESAIRELENTIRAKPDEKPPKLKLAELYGRANPPKWSQAERVLTDARSAPGMTDDVDLIHAEAVMWLGRKNYDQARTSIEQAIKLAPTNLKLLNTYCDVLMGLKAYQGVLKVTDPFLKSKSAPPWVYQFRGRAKKAMDDKQGAIDEWSVGIDLASAAKDDNAIEHIIKTIANEMGAKVAIQRILPRADKDNRWRLIVAYLYQSDGDMLNAITWVEKALADEANLSPEAWDTARRMAGAFYLAVDPPDTQKALVNYKKMLERNPNDPAALNNMACTLIMTSSKSAPQEAITYSQKAYDILEQSGSKNPYISDTHGYLMILNGKVEEGIAKILEAIDQEAIPDAYYHLAEGYLARPTPSVAEAEQALKQALQLIDRATAENKSLDASLKAKVEKALEKCKQLTPATAPAGKT